MRTRSERLLGIIILVMALVTVGQTAWYSWEQQKCNEAFAQNLALRSKWWDEERRAMQDFWLQVYRHPDDRQANLRAFTEWVHTFQENNRRRARTPLPDLADCE